MKELMEAIKHYAEVSSRAHGTGQPTTKKEQVAIRKMLRLIFKRKPTLEEVEAIAAFSNEPIGDYEE